MTKADAYKLSERLPEKRYSWQKDYYYTEIIHTAVFLDEAAWMRGNIMSADDLMHELYDEMSAGNQCVTAEQLNDLLEVCTLFDAAEGAAIALEIKNKFFGNPDKIGCL